MFVWVARAVILLFSEHLDVTHLLLDETQPKANAQSHRFKHIRALNLTLISLSRQLVRNESKTKFIVHAECKN